MKKALQITKTIIMIAVVLSVALATPLNSIPVTGESINSSNPIPVTAVPTLNGFVQSISAVNVASANTIVGIYAPDKFAMSIVQQPAGDAGYISTENEIVTQFAMASQFGTIGLLAHNFLGGAHFSDVSIDQTIVLVKGDQSLAYYKVESIQTFQALTPNSPYSNFKALDGSERVLSANDMFTNIYMQSGKLILQTCVAEGDELSWGRLFITASPIDSPLS